MAAMATHDHPGLELGPVAFVVSLGWMLAPGATLIAIALHQGPDRYTDLLPSPRLLLVTILSQ